ncbi:unnamed protein product, partial [Polarella glacialis]
MCKNQTRRVNLAGLTSIESATRKFAGVSARVLMASDLLGGEPSPGTPQGEGGASRRSGFGRLWHQGQCLDVDACRESLLGGEPPHLPVVVFRESNEGRHLFNTTLQRALTRNPVEHVILAASLDRLLLEARRRQAAMDSGDASGSGVGLVSWQESKDVEVSFPDHHAMLAELEFQRDFDEQLEPVLMVSSVSPDGIAEHAGITVGWTLPNDCRPEDLILTAPHPQSVGLVGAVAQVVAGQVPSAATVEWT